jgi:hypothetical protein
MMNDVMASLMGGGETKLPGGAKMDAKGLADMMDAMKEV